jgi:hypothetical protein
MQVRFVDELKGKRRHRERQQRFFLYVFMVFCYCRSVFFACFRNFTNTQQVKDLSSEAGRNEMEISSWYPSLPFTLCDRSFSFFYSGTEEVLLIFFAFWVFLFIE